MASAALMAACSSMDIDDDKALSENFPSDFTVGEYLAINPQVSGQQLRDYVSNFNAKKKVELGDAYEAKAAADEEAFVADTASMHLILVDPSMGGYNEVNWATIWAKVVKETKDTASGTVKVDTVQNTISGSDLSYVMLFNLVGETNDYAALQKAPIDTFAVTYHFVLYGKTHGWAYRPCKDSEKNHPVQTETFPVKKLYCDDNGVAKEI